MRVVWHRQSVVGANICDIPMGELVGEPDAVDATVKAGLTFSNMVGQRCALPLPVGRCLTREVDYHLLPATLHRPANARSGEPAGPDCTVQPPEVGRSNGVRRGRRRRVCSQHRKVPYALPAACSWQRSFTLTKAHVAPCFSLTAQPDHRGTVEHDLHQPRHVPARLRASRVVPVWHLRPWRVAQAVPASAGRRHRLSGVCRVPVQSP